MTHDDKRWYTYGNYSARKCVKFTQSFELGYQNKSKLNYHNNDQ